MSENQSDFSYEDGNDTNGPFHYYFVDINYDRYVFFSVCSALIGLPLNILLIAILLRHGLSSRRINTNSIRISYSRTTPTGSFERFLFEIVLIDTLLILYHFIDNFLSYIHKDRSAGQHYLIHISDFCCKFFTYFAKMSVLLETWLLLFLILNQFILTMKYNEKYSFWHRSLEYINAKYSTVFLVFIFGLYNIYPIEVLKYQGREDIPDYHQEGVAGVCSPIQDSTSKKLLNATNYGYHLIGILIPCLIMFIVSIIIIQQTCQNKRYDKKLNNPFKYIAATIGIIHSLFNFPPRLSDMLLMLLSPYSPFFSDLINFNHDIQAILCLSYTFKCFVCILISQRFRRHAKNILCFLIENKYDDCSQHRSDALLRANNHRRYTTANLHSLKVPVLPLPKGKFSIRTSQNDNLPSYSISEAIYWTRPYFTRNKTKHCVPPYERSASCHQLSAKFCSSQTTISSSPAPTTHLSSYFVVIDLPNGEHLHIPLPHKHKSNCQTLSSRQVLNHTLTLDDTENRSINRLKQLSSSHIY